MTSCSLLSAPPRPKRVPNTAMALILGLLLSIAPATGLQAQNTGDLLSLETPLQEAEADIVAVTVFPDLARVTRQLQVALPAGQTSLAITNLPAGLFPDSIRVEGTGSGALTIGSVELKQHFEGDLVQAEERRLQQALEALQDRSRALDDEIAAARLRLAFISALGREVPASENQDISRGQVDPAGWQAAWSALGQGAAEAFAEIRKAEIEQRALARKIEQQQRALDQVATGQTSKLQAVVQLETDSPTTASLTLAYQLPGASWRPLYDARLDSENGALTLVQSAEVRQQSGEDWRGVHLTLSTARPSQDAEGPALAPWFLDFETALLAHERTSVQHKKSFQDTSGLAQFEADALAPSQFLSSEPAGQALEELPADHQTADLVAAGFSARYEIPGRSSVTADGAPQKFVIAEREMTAELSLYSVPKLQAQAYLTGEILHSGEEALLPGPVAIFRDGNFVGRSHMDLARPGESIALSFGPDDKVKVDYRLMGGERSQEGLIERDQRLERRFQIEITNHHDRPIDILVLDQIPVAQDERIKISLLPDSTQPSEKDADNKPGLLAWDHNYLANETRVIDFGYAVTFPEELKLQGF